MEKSNPFRQNWFQILQPDNPLNPAEFLDNRIVEVALGRTDEVKDCLHTIIDMNCREILEEYRFVAEIKDNPLFAGIENDDLDDRKTHLRILGYLTIHTRGQ